MEVGENQEGVVWDLSFLYSTLVPLPISHFVKLGCSRDGGRRLAQHLGDRTLPTMAWKGTKEDRIWGSLV